jgi:rhodanese-related sulfurtransferase
MAKKISFMIAGMAIFTLACSNQLNNINIADFDNWYYASAETVKAIETTPEVTFEAIKNKTHIIIDVRELSEYQEVHIKEVKLLPMSVLASEIGKLDKNLQYITVCRSGSRSARAADEMQKIGLNAVSMKGGMNSWVQKGLPVIKPVKK